MIDKITALFYLYLQKKIGNYKSLEESSRCIMFVQAFAGNLAKHFITSNRSSKSVKQQASFSSETWIEGFLKP